MSVGLLLDTGPLVALLNRRDRHHAWTTALLDSTGVPLATCEAVVSEACFLARRAGVHADQVLELVSAIAAGPTFRLDEERIEHPKALPSAVYDQLDEYRRRVV